MRAGSSGTGPGEIAVDRRVPKRDYLLNIVAYHARDICHAVYHGE